MREMLQSFTDKFLVVCGYQSATTFGNNRRCIFIAYSMGYHSDNTLVCFIAIVRVTWIGIIYAKCPGNIGYIDINISRINTKP